MFSVYDEKFSQENKQKQPVKACPPSWSTKGQRQQSWTGVPLAAAAWDLGQRLVSELRAVSSQEQGHKYSLCPEGGVGPWWLQRNTQVSISTWSSGSVLSALAAPLRWTLEVHKDRHRLTRTAWLRDSQGEPWHSLKCHLFLLELFRAAGTSRLHMK